MLFKPFKKISPKSIRAKIVIWFSIASLLMITLLNVTTTAIVSSLLKEREIEHVKNQIHYGANIISEYIKSEQNSLSLLATNPLISAGATNPNLLLLVDAQLDDVVNIVLAQERGIKDIIISNSQEIIYNKSGLAEGLGVPDRMQLIDAIAAIKKNLIYFKPATFFGYAKAVPSLALTQEIINKNGTNKYWLTALIDLNVITANLLKKEKLNALGGNELVISLLINYNNSLTSPEIGTDPNQGDSAVVQRGLSLLQGQSAAMQGQGAVENDDLMIYTTQVDNMPMSVASFVQKNELFARIKKISFIIYGLGFLVVLISSFLSYIVGNYMVKPLLQLDNKVRLMASGYLHTRTKIDSNDELGMLGENFNKMAESIEKLTANIDKSKNQLESILEVTQRITQASTVAEIIALTIVFMNKELQNKISNASAVIHSFSGKNMEYRYTNDASVSDSFEEVKDDDLNKAMEEFTRRFGFEVQPIYFFNKTSVCIHLIYRGEYYGHMSLNFSEPMTYDNNIRHFIDIISTSLVIVISNMEETERKIKDEQQSLMQHVAMAAHISDGLNSPLLVASNVCNKLYKKASVVHEMHDKSDKDKFYLLLNAMNQSLPFAIDSIETMKKLSEELAKLRDVDANIESTFSIFKTLEKKPRS